MRAAVILVLVLVLVVIGLARIAAADPAHSCGELRPLSWARMTQAQRERFPSGDTWREHATPWAKMRVVVTIDRAPHLARGILLECPGVASARPADALDVRHFRSELQITVTSYAALLRIVQLPAVRYIYVDDPTLIKPMMPEAAQPPMSFP